MDSVVPCLSILKVWLYLDNEMTNLGSQQSDLECLVLNFSLNDRKDKILYLFTLPGRT